MQAWEKIAEATAPDGEALVLRRRGQEFSIFAGGKDLMSSDDERSSRALAELGCAHFNQDQSACVLVGGLGMGYTLRAALDATGPRADIEVAELVPEVAEWNRDFLGDLAEQPLQDDRTGLYLGDVAVRIAAARGLYDAILLDVDNGPIAHAHRNNDRLYSGVGLEEAWRALRPGGVLAVWSFADDASFTRRLERQGFLVAVNRVAGSRKGRGRHHVVWTAKRRDG